MPRKTISIQKPPKQHAAFVEKLGAALKSKVESGQPMVYEQELAPNRLKTTVVWDAWRDIPLDERTAIVLAAYDSAEGDDFSDKLALAGGFTMPEATAAGMLPYEIVTALRKGDPVTFEQCWQAMLEEGASELFRPGILRLRFPTRDEAEACRERLIRRLPKSDDVWLVHADVSVHDYLSPDESFAVHT